MATVLLLVMAGHETTANVLGNAVARLVADPAARAVLAELAELAGEDGRVDDAGHGDPGAVGRDRDGRAGMRAAVEEFLRLDGPVQMATRVTRRPTRIGDVDLAAGRIVVVVLAAANRDPAAFADPERLDLRRSSNPHLAFGSGLHYCIGASLARLELRVALRALGQRLPPGAHVAGRAALRPSFTIRGFATLPLAW